MPSCKVNAHHYNDCGWNDLHYNDCGLYSGRAALHNRRNPVLQRR